MIIPFKTIPTYDVQTNNWGETTFPSQSAFVDFLKSIFREPGEYEFDESTIPWNTLGKKFQQRKYYTSLPHNTKDWISFWDIEKRKCRLGIIWKNGNKVWYLTREYYQLLNFLPIINKEKGSIESFPDIRDTQYHMSLYEKIAEGIHKHSGLLKKRQMLSSYYHCAKLFNFFWFEKNKRLKMFASDDDYISGKQGSWAILESYRDFTNQHTAWFRNCQPNEVGNWEQKIRIKRNGRTVTQGNKSSIIAKTLKRDPSKGVGGPAYIVFYEEAGIAPTMDVTLQFMNPALESGLTKVGSFIAAGSVGDLTDCKPLEKFIKDPDLYEIHGVPTKWYDETGVIKTCGLFIPEQYGMDGHIDQYGNSLVESALKALDEAEIEWKKLPAAEYQLKKSQKPRTIKEAFAFRNELYFPTQLIERRQQIITEQVKEGLLKPLKGILRETDGVIEFIPVSRLPEAERPIEMEFPVDPKQKDKRGVVIIYEMPKMIPVGGDAPEFGVYFGGVDTIEANITFTSESLYSVSIVKRLIEVHDEDDKGNRTVRYEGGKMVACYTGRYDDINDTNNQGELLIRMFNALSAVERNKPNFINHMRRKGYAKLIAKRKELTLFKDVDMTGYDTDEYGIYLGSDGKANDIINSNILEDLTTELDAIHKKNKDGSLGEVVKVIKGIDLIDDYWTLEELKFHQKDINTDRRISFGLAKTLAKCYELMYKKRVIGEVKKKQEAPRQEGFRSAIHNPYKGKPRSLLGF